MQFSSSLKTHQLRRPDFIIFTKFPNKKTLISVKNEEKPARMSYDDVEIEDMEWNDELQAFTYPCPCGDLFQITKEDLKLGEEIARCPSCSLYITVIYNMEDFLGDSNKHVEPSKQQPIAVA
ncbi:diphthamide biosynthesis protein 3-like [Nicotiana tomentosiformis]|nr:diphthamide biosynthesis protein 3-like [Nicotiana tomentosiformis]